MFSMFKRLSGRLRRFFKFRIHRRKTRIYGWRDQSRDRSRRRQYYFNYSLDALHPGDRYATVSDLCSRVGRQLPLDVVKLMAKDIVKSLESFRSIHGKAHGDIKFETILLSPGDMKSLVAQLSADGRTQSSRSSGYSCGTFHLDFRALLASDSTPAIFSVTDVRIDDDSSNGIFSCSFTPPEVLLGSSDASAVDIWSLGCVLYELITGESLFDPFFQTIELGLSLEESHLIQMIELFGPFPQDLLASGERTSKWFNATGAMHLETTYYSVTLDAVLRNYFDEGDAASATGFLRTMLQLRPQDRWSPRDILGHPWLRI